MRMPCCWQRGSRVGCSAANQGGTSPGTSSNSSSHDIGDGVSEQGFVLSISFCFSLAAQSSLSNADLQAGLCSTGLPWPLLTVGRWAFPRLSWSAPSASLCAFWHSSEVAHCGCLYFCPETSQEIVKLILEAKTVERGPWQMQPEYLPSNRLWNLTDAKAFSWWYVY